jgi:hypothetical protein
VVTRLWTRLCCDKRKIEWTCISGIYIRWQIQRLHAAFERGACEDASRPEPSKRVATHSFIIITFYQVYKDSIEHKCEWDFCPEPISTNQSLDSKVIEDIVFSGC